LLKVLALDIDGVLTDGRVTLDGNGRELKTLSYRDIDALFLAQRRGVRVVLVTGESSDWVAMVARRNPLFSPAAGPPSGSDDQCASSFE